MKDSDDSPILIKVYSLIVYLCLDVLMCLFTHPCSYKSSDCSHGADSLSRSPPSKHIPDWESSCSLKLMWALIFSNLCVNNGLDEMWINPWEGFWRIWTLKIMKKKEVQKIVLFKWISKRKTWLCLWYSQGRCFSCLVTLPWICFWRYFYRRWWWFHSVSLCIMQKMLQECECASCERLNWDKGCFS